MSSGEISLFDKALDAHIDAVRENTRQLQMLSLDMSKQTTLSERQTVAMEAIADKLGGIDRHVEEVDDKLSEKVGSLITSLKVQWVTISIGILPVLYFVVKKWTGD